MIVSLEHKFKFNANGLLAIKGDVNTINNVCQGNGDNINVFDHFGDVVINATLA